jgi:rhomboid protease GluP
VDVEARLLLYTVVLGAVAGLVQLFRRKASAFRVYFAELSLVLAVAAAGVVHPSWARALAMPSFSAFVAVAIAPSALIETSRRAARRRRYLLAWTSATTGAALLGLPAPLRREAALYGAMEAAERGDEAACRARLERVARSVGIPPDLGGEALVTVLPAAARRRWSDVLAALAGAPLRSPPLLAVEARAAAETGDLPRTLRVCRDIESLGGGPSSARSSARRSLLAAAGRAAFLAEAAERRLPVVAGPPGTAELAIARAHEALGDAASARAGYERARRVGRGGVRLDADAGAQRCESGALVFAAPGAIDASVLAALETVCRAERAPPGEIPLTRRAPFSLGVAALTAVVSIAVFAAFGLDSVALVGAGALSAPLVLADGEWWRLGTTMLLHVGWFHLAMNVGTILLFGAPLETRAGAARTAVVYLASGFAASVASVVVARTDVGVGASGAAMGLIGALGVTVFARRSLFGEAERRRWIAAIVLTVVATGAIGLLESEAIDNTAHAAGLVAGALFGWLLLPDGADRPARAALHRAAAAALAGLTLACAAAAAARSGEWRGTRDVASGRARAEIPAWLRVRAARGGAIVASRAPLGLAVEIGAAPDEPRPLDVVPDEEAPRALFAAGPARAARGALPDGATSESADYVAEGGAGFRLRTFRRGAAFALVVVPLGPDGETEGDELAVRIGRSLRDVE